MTLGAELIGVVVDAARFSPRSKQTAVGPSEIGEPCQRQLAYKLSGAPKLGDGDPWAAIVGTATHAWLAAAFAANNLTLDEPRWIVEQRVHPSSGISGNCDLYDLWTDTAIDWKVVGVTTLREAKRNGPSQKYRIQAHTYALGWERLGRMPREVAIAYWPRSGFSSDLFIYREPYDRSIAEEALNRVSRISAAALSLDIIEHPEMAMLIPAEPSEDCRFCPYRTTHRGDGGCPGMPAPEPPKGVPGITRE